MARKLRLEFPGAIYHVISRGNYRQDVFAAEKTKAAFEDCLFEACRKSGWVLHGFVIMSNHFHLAWATPKGNLVTGMRWLLSTFSTRFNRYRNERGHVFQGRYKSLLVEAGAALGQVCHYVHLNPVRAGVLPVAELRTYRYGSYWYLWKRASRPKFLAVTTALREAGDLGDDRRGWQAYEKYLAWQAAEGPAGKSKAYVSLSRGWALGASEFKKALVIDHQLAATAKAWESAGAREVREIQWQEAVEESLRRLRIPAERIRADRKSAAWKVAIAAHLKGTTQAGNGWLAEHLSMGKSGSVSFYVSRARREAAGSEIHQYIQILEH